MHACTIILITHCILVNIRYNCFMYSKKRCNYLHPSHNLQGNGSRRQEVSIFYVIHMQTFRNNIFAQKRNCGSEKNHAWKGTDQAVELLCKGTKFSDWK